ncbi:MAG: universal stress protein [Rhodospirillaceae bacterium]|nr:universal stress protein [Rhodospirillaceae bacterium]MBL6930029.1 universal stress protein [Rhodospirillales bacterium]MBL6940947.1 universal stress protein [Rhodospirillales bacterium]
MSIYLAYDGSINANWIARYAIRMAANHPEKQLHVVYIEDAEVPAPELSANVKQIEAEAAAVGVNAMLEVCPMHQGVFGGLVDYIPAGPQTFVICGARVKKGRRGFLAGTISEQLLSLRHFNVLALRVVQPGLLGLPRDVLVPVSGDRQGIRAGLSILELMIRDIHRLHLLNIVEARRSPFRLQSSADTRKQRAQAMTYVRTIEDELLRDLAIDPKFVDSHVVVAKSWSRETILHASRLHAHLIFIEAKHDSLTRRLLFDDEIEQLLGQAPCDVAVYRGVT